MLRKGAISTPIRDVVSLYGSAVHIGKDADQFVAAVEDLLDEPPQARAQRRARGQALVDGCTWDGTAAFIAAMLLEYAPAAPAEPIVLHEPLADATPLVAAHDEVAEIPVLTDRVELPAQPLSM